MFKKLYIILPFTGLVLLLGVFLYTNRDTHLVYDEIKYPFLKEVRLVAESDISGITIYPIDAGRKDADAVSINDLKIINEFKENLSQSSMPFLPGHAKILLEANVAIRADSGVWIYQFIVIDPHSEHLFIQKPGKRYMVWVQGKSDWFIGFYPKGLTALGEKEFNL